MDPDTQIDYKSLIRDVPDFPKAGIVFKDITPLFQDARVLSRLLDDLTAPWKDKGIDVVAGAEARGFLTAPGIAERLGAGFVPIRKPGKLPHETLSCSYELEYGTDTLEVHRDALKGGKNVLLADDLLATGGTMKACIDLMTELGANIIGASFIIELSFLSGQEKLSPVICQSLIQYDAE
jgi:adenine phosphoribosyltransferase